MAKHPTFRVVDGEKIPGTIRKAFIRNGRYYLADLVIYADGLIDCWGLVDLAEFEEKLRSGWIATTLEEGAVASVHHVARWKFSEARSLVTPAMLLGEVRDEIDRLNGRRDSRGRCRAVVDAYIADRTDERRQQLLDAYLAVPEHLRRYLGDMDSKDWPFQVLAGGIGGRMPVAQTLITEEMHARALNYFAEGDRAGKDSDIRTEAFGPAQPTTPAIRIGLAPVPDTSADSVDEVGLHALRNDYPSPLRVDGVEYPDVYRAYLALSTADAAQRRAILEAATNHAARRAAEAAPRRPGWAPARPAVMAQLMRAKYAQSPALARLLLSTGDAQILYYSADSPYWSERGERGRNWVGRLLELIRSELAADAAGLGVA
jgi:predicted NAD-dependent protein-ADP-ribosyltransferase YbiA (DUF1768 family)